ncbi:MAG: hypothetical protein JXR37_22955 [Kiritimatiellae bacterium]|nr:hypothetical protein [Kiritimatiellia bacterium]
MNMARTVFFSAACVFLAQAMPAGCDDVPAQAAPPAAARPDSREERAAPGGADAGLQAELDRLRKLRTADPAAFGREIEQRRQRMRQYLLVLRETDPDAYRRALEKLQEYRQRRLQTLRQADPARFVAQFGRRRQSIQQRLDALREQDPARHEQLMQRWERLRAMSPAERREWFRRTWARRRERWTR